MKILQSCGSRSWGGLEMQALSTCVELRKRRHDVNLLCLPRSPLLREANTVGVPTVGLLGEDKNALATIKDLSRLLRSYDYDVVHTHLSHDLWWIVPAMKLSSSGAGLFLTKHMASGIKKHDPLHRILYGRLQGTFAISNYIKKSVLDTCPVDESTVHVLPPGISLEEFDPGLYDKSEVRDELGIPGSVVLIGMIGRMSPGKGHEEFLNAAKVLLETSGLNLKFLVIGGASSGEERYEARIREMAIELGLTGALSFTGFRKDVARLLSSIDVLAFPSHEESFGVTLVEAMAMKISVVASESAGVLDIVVGDETGLFSRPKDFRSLAGGILKLASNPQMRQLCGEAGRMRVEHFFSLKGMTDKLEGYYAQYRKS